MSARTYTPGDVVRFDAYVTEDDGVGDLRRGDVGEVLSTDDGGEGQGLLVAFYGAGIVAVNAGDVVPATARDAFGTVRLNGAHWVATRPDGTATRIPLSSTGDAYADALAVLGLRHPHRLNGAIATLRGWGIDDGDTWGDCLMMLGAVCDVLYVMGGAIPPEAGYHPGALSGRASLEEMADGADPRTAGLAAQYLAGAVSQRDLELAARALDRWADLLQAAGKDY